MHARTLTALTLTVSTTMLAYLSNGASGEPGPTTAPAAIRIKAGSDKPLTDKSGNVWQADTGFVGGDTIERPLLKITGTELPELFLSEHYDMTAFKQSVPNGKYTVKLYVAETYEDVKAIGGRVLHINVEGQDLKNFDPFKEAGAANKAVVKSFDVEVKDEALDITFTAVEQAPALNAIEILPRP